MPTWTDYEIQRDFTDWADLCDAHNADIEALTAERDEWKEKERITSELFEAACNDLGDAQEELAAAIEYANSRDAERDELQRRLDEVVGICKKMNALSTREWGDLWDRPKDVLLRSAVAIAEGRTE